MRDTAEIEEIEEFLRQHSIEAVKENLLEPSITEIEEVIRDLKEEEEYRKEIQKHFLKEE